MSVSFELKGMDELRRKLRMIPADLEAKGFRSGMRKAANLVRDAAKSNAEGVDDPETGERIADNIAVRFSPKEYKRDKSVVFRVGVLGGARKPDESGKLKVKQKGGATWYWRFVEFGTSSVRARPFMRPALANNVEAATNTATEAINKEIDRAVRKAGGKA